MQALVVYELRPEEHQKQVRIPAPQLAFRMQAAATALFRVPQESDFLESLPGPAPVPGRRGRGRRADQQPFGEVPDGRARTANRPPRAGPRNGYQSGGHRVVDRAVQPDPGLDPRGHAAHREGAAVLLAEQDSRQ